MRLQLNCNGPVEFSYYSASDQVGRKDICAYCATPVADRDRELLQKFKIVLPLCDTCKSRGKTALKRNRKPSVICVN